MYIYNISIKKKNLYADLGTRPILTHLARLLVPYSKEGKLLT